ncbi:ABC transporter permease [Caldimonas tepidiphila]|uniref:ABC transporter permease n=1 Tax=Caldimonas tepidiphila TaxID=2315841 RepID=UPI000E5BB763|nr:ABC transporter permease [Caldimonas tepidiphila]
MQQFPQGLGCAKRTPWQIQRAVVFALFQRELKTRFGGRWLGMLWVVFEPLAHVLVMLAVFGFMRHTMPSGIDYPVFLATGLLPFFIFKNLSLRLMGAIESNRGLFSYRQVKPMDTLVSRALLELCIYGTVYVLTLLLLGWLGLRFIPTRPLELLAVSALLVLLGMSLGLVFAVATHAMPRLGTFIQLAFMPLYFVSGVLFPVHAVPADLRPWLLWNPVLHLIELSRGCFFPQYHVLPGISAWFAAGVTLPCALLGLSLYRVRRERLLATS